MKRFAAALFVAGLLGACSSSLSVDLTLAESIQQIGMATTGQVEFTQEQWVEVAIDGCEQGAHLDAEVAAEIAEDHGVVFIGTDRPVVETVQVIAEAVCSVNSER